MPKNGLECGTNIECRLQVIRSRPIEQRFDTYRHALQVKLQKVPLRNFRTGIYAKEHAAFPKCTERMKMGNTLVSTGQQWPTDR